MTFLFSKKFSWTTIWLSLILLGLSFVALEHQVLHYQFPVNIFIAHSYLYLEGIYIFLISFLLVISLASALSRRPLLNVANFFIRFVPLTLLWPLIERFVLGHHTQVIDNRFLYEPKALALFYFLPFLILINVIYGVHNKAKYMAIMKNLRPLRAFMFMLAVLMGGGALYFSNLPVSWPMVIVGMLACAFVWEVSVVVNDIYDLDIDRMTNPERPLVSGLVSVENYRFLGYLFSFLCVTFAASLSWPSFVVSIVCVVLAYIYSSPPLRLRQNLAGNVLIGVSLSLSFLLGLYISGYWTIALDGLNITFLLILFLFGTIITFVKDIKDVEGDTEAGIENLFTMNGKEEGKRIVTIIIGIGAALPAILMSDLMLMLLFVLYGGILACVFYFSESIKFTYVMAAIEVVILFAYVYAFVH